jgi:hypothetical protein
MVSILLIFLAGACNAIMDRISMEHFDSSRFHKLNPGFWNADISWRNKWKGGMKSCGEKFWGSSRLFVWMSDAWHLFKSIMLVLILLAVVLYRPIINIYFDFALNGAIWVFGFTLFYNKILPLKN